MTLKRGTFAAAFALGVSVAATAFAMPKVMNKATPAMDTPIETVATMRCSSGKGKKHCTRHRSSRPAPSSDYQQYWAEKLPFGTSTWWDQMQRENRGGNPGGGGGFGG